MKKLNYLLKAVMAIAVVALFAQCKDAKVQEAANSGNVQTPELNGMKIAYVEIDTLLAKYNFWVDLNEQMVKKSENVRLELSKKAKELDGQAREFQEKVQNGIYASKERVEQEQARILKLKENFDALSARLQNELMQENEKNSILLRDSINAFLKEFNKTKKYSMIISNTGFDNLLYADSIYNITNEVVAGLNARYSKK